jgi:small subunit ribosomal protein S10
LFGKSPLKKGAFYLKMPRGKTPKETKIRIKLKSYDSRIIDLSCSKIVDTAIRTGAQIVGPVPLPTKIERFTVIRGPHIDKRSREQFELRTHKRVIDVLNPTPSTIETLSKLSLPAGVGISIKM